jgi:hypothetical protein
MDSFDGGRRRDPRSPLPPTERRPLREGEPLEQRLDRWMSTGRQLVEGVSGGRPGARQGSRRPEGRPGNRGGFDGLGRWVENRLDWLLDDSDDWPEPWQQSEGRRGDPARPLRPTLPVERDGGSGRGRLPRQPLQAISRRVGMPAAMAAPPSSEWQAPATPSRSTQTAAAEPVRAHSGSDAPQEWPDDEAFSVPRWQRPSAPLRRPDPLVEELEQRNLERAEGTDPAAAAPARRLPRSSRRR